MRNTQKMLKSSPMLSQKDVSMLSDCIEACFDCAQICNTCANACINENQYDMLIRCIELNQYCADVCLATGNMLSRSTSLSADLLQNQAQICMDACRACAEECEMHASRHEHCKICADSCRQCENSCNQMLSSMPVTSGR